MTGILVLFAVFGYATAAGAARQLHASEFERPRPKHRTVAEQQTVRAALAILWPITLPVMLGILLSRRLIAKARAGAAEKDRLAENGGIMLGSRLEIRDDDTYRRLRIAVQKYEREKGYDG